MDATRRNIFTTIGCGAVVAGIVLLATHTYILAGALIAGGILALVVAWGPRLGSPQGPEEQPPDATDGGPMVFAESLVNNGIIAHTVNQPAPPPVAPQPTMLDKRWEFRERVQRLIEEGQRLAHYDVDRLVRDAPKWQERGFDLLYDALEEINEATYFQGLGTPLADLPLNAGLGQRVGQQVVCLNDVLRRFDSLHIKESWTI